MSLDLIATENSQDVFDLDVQEIVDTSAAPDGAAAGQVPANSEITCTFTSTICCCP